MTPEQKLYDRIKRGMSFAHWQRFEDTLSAGIPDLNGCYLGTEVWIEAKVAKSDGRVIVRPAQIAWLAKRWAHGGLAWIMVEHRDLLRVWEGGLACEVFEHGWKARNPHAEWPARHTTPWGEVWRVLAHR